MIKKLAKQGKSIIYISHRLDEIFVISNRVMVMRDGRNVGVFNTDQTSKSQIVNYMVGREIKDMYPIKRRQIGEKVLEVENLNTEKAVNINFNIRKGEIVGLFGLMGSGRTNIVEAIFGANKKHSGTIKIDGEKVNIANPSMAIRAGIGYVPSERKTDGLVLIQSVKENISLAYIDRFRKKVSLDLKREEVYVKDWVKKLSIKTSDINNEIQTLSGGNQQKVILAKWMMTNPKVLILNEPTRGIDVGAKVEIYKLMEDFCDKGLGIVMISSELPEILAICDRVITICEGRITGEYTQSEISQEKLLLGAIGEC
jgi:ribose transport system ATP-binding protein